MRGQRPDFETETAIETFLRCCLRRRGRVEKRPFGRYSIRRSLSRAPSAVAARGAINIDRTRIIGRRIKQRANAVLAFDIGGRMRPIMAGGNT